MSKPVMNLQIYTMRCLMKDNKITSHPPRKKTIEDFILDAEGKKSGKEKEHLVVDKTLPWEYQNIRKDVQKVFTVKLPEEYILKIKFISEQTNKSQQKIIREIICTNVDN